MSVPPTDGWHPTPSPSGPINHGQMPAPPGFAPHQPLGSEQYGTWPRQPAPPPPKRTSLKWLLIGVAVLLVIAISVGATLILTRDTQGGGATLPTPDAPGAVASAKDTGPVEIITEEPTCDKYLPISNSLSDIEAKSWGASRSTLGPASEWTSEQRSEVQQVATAMRNAADQVVPLARQTPHRLVREIYEAFIAYGRAYADSLANYTPQDDGLASANVSAGSALVGICSAIEYGSANRAIGVETADPPSTVGAVGDPARPNRLLSEPNPSCGPWIERMGTFAAKTPEWQARDTSIPASEWSPEQRAADQSARPLLTAFANEVEDAGRGSGNAVLEDFAVAIALYTKAYVSVGDGYNGAADSWLNFVAFRLANVVAGACESVSG